MSLTTATINSINSIGSIDSMSVDNFTFCENLLASRIEKDFKWSEADGNWEEVFYAPIPDFVHYMCACILVCLLVPGILGNSAAIAIFIQ